MSNSGSEAADPRIQGLFPILSAPFTVSGAVDFEDLAREARFVNWCGANGMIWPQSGDSIDLLSKEKKRADEGHGGLGKSHSGHEGCALFRRAGRGH